MTTLTRVVNLRKESYTSYIGRKDKEMHYGNPFSVGKSNIASLQVDSKEKALLYFYHWVNGDLEKVVPEKLLNELQPMLKTIEPRRQWIVENLEALRGKTLGCFCKPYGCHGDIYRVLLGEITLDEAMEGSWEKKTKPESTKPVADTPQMGLF